MKHKSRRMDVAHEQGFLNAVLEHAGALVVVLDCEGRIVRFNSACEKLSGLRFPEVEGKYPWETFLPPEDADTIHREAFLALASDPQALAGQYTNYWLNTRGERRLIEWSNTVLRNPDGSLGFMICIGHDITRRQQMELALRDSEALLRHTQAIASVGSWIMDLDTRVLTWSDETYRIFGVEQDRFAHTYEAFLAAVHPDDRAAVDTAYGDAVRNHTSYDIRHRIVRPDGSVHWVQERGDTVYNDDSRALRTIGSVQDITHIVRFEHALAESEANFRSLTENANVGILVGTPERTLYANPCLLEMLGYSFDEFTRIGMKESIHPAELEKVSARFRERLSGKQAPSVYETVFVARDGHAVPVEITPTITTWRGEKAGLLFVQDIRPRLDAEQRYHSVVATMAEGVVVQQADGQIVANNAAAEDILGLSADQMRGRTAMDPRWRSVRDDGSAFPGDEHPGTVALRTGHSFRNVVMGVDHPEKGRRWISINADPLRRPGTGLIYGSVASFTDITERNSAEQALRENNQVMSAVLDTTPVLIAYLDPDLNFVRVNHAYAAADNKVPDFFPGRNHFDLYPNPENEAIFRQVVQTGKPHVEVAKPFAYENAPERGVTHWDWTLTPIKDEKGRVTGLVLSLMNVTDRIQTLETLQRKEQELTLLNENLESRVSERTAELHMQAQRNETILNSTIDGFCAADVDGSIVDANPAYCDMLGYSRDELLGLNVRDIEANESPQEVTEHIQKIMATGHDRFDTRYRHKDGRIIDVELSIRLVEIGGKKLLYAFARDITTRKQSEAALIRARDEAEQANRAKNDFLSRISHELRTPMNAIIGFAQVLEMEGLDPEFLDYVSEIHRAGDHLLELINELLDLSRIESGQLQTVMQPVLVKTVTDEAARFASALMTANRITLHNQCDPAIEVLADPTRLKQILINLVSNAAKYNRPGGRVLINCRNTDDGLIRIAVTDTGRGILPEHQERLFTPFERLGAEHSEIEGTGIGLALSRRLTELMGGRMGVETTPGEGTTFWLTLPLVYAPQSKAPPRVLVQDPVHDETVATRKILYIEDNAANLKVVEAMFRHRPNLALLSATSGEYGLELARRYTPDAILLDIHLPGLDGYGVLKALQADPETREIPVIALSADAMPIDIEKGMKAGFRDYLTKPVRMDMLMACLDRLIPGIPAGSA